MKGWYFRGALVKLARGAAGGYGGQSAEDTREGVCSLRLKVTAQRTRHLEIFWGDAQASV